MLIIYSVAKIPLLLRSHSLTLQHFSLKNTVMILITKLTTVAPMHLITGQITGMMVMIVIVMVVMMVMAIKDEGRDIVT